MAAPAASHTDAPSSEQSEQSKYSERLKRAYATLEAIEPRKTKWWHDAVPFIQHNALSRKYYPEYIEWAASVHTHPTIIEFRNYVDLDEFYYYDDMRELFTAVYSMWHTHAASIGLTP